MKRSDLHPGDKVAYRFTYADGRVAEAKIIAVNQDGAPFSGSYDGEEVYGRGPILFELHGYERSLRAEYDARPFQPWDEYAAEHAHRRLRGARMAGAPDTWTGVALVSSSWFSWDAERREPVWHPDDFRDAFSWKVVDVERRDGRWYAAEPGTTGFELVDAGLLFGPDWIAQRQDRERMAAETEAKEARRKEVGASAAERVGLLPEQISVGAQSWRGAGTLVHTVLSPHEVLVCVPVHVLAGLLERAADDPEWADNLRMEGVLDALGQ